MWASWRPSGASVASLFREGLRRIVNPEGDGAEDGWATASLHAAIRTALLVGTMGWQSLMILMVLASLGRTSDAILLVVGHGLAVVLAGATLRWGWNRSAICGSAYVLFLADWLSIPSMDSPLIFASWLMVILSAANSLEGRRWWVVPLGAFLTVPAIMVASRPEWAFPLPLSVAMLIPSLTPATRIGLSYIVDYTHAADRESRGLDARTTALGAQRSAIAAAAEDARVLHDTAVNTLGAIANGGAGTRDQEAVRLRCLADVETLTALKASAQQAQAEAEGLRNAIRSSRVRVRHRGLVGDALAELESRLPAAVVRALGRAAAEAVQNAEKHSGVDDVDVTIDHARGRLTVEIHDNGVGAELAPRPGGGIERSIMARTAEVGVLASLRSAPGEGTTVTLSYEIEERAIDANPFEGLPLDDVVRQVRVRTAILMVAGLNAAAVALAASHLGHAALEWPMIALASVSGIHAWRARSLPRLPLWTTLALVVEGPVAFVLSSWAVGFGRIEPLLWMSLPPVSATMVLILMANSLRTKIVALAVYATTAITVAVIVGRVSSSAAYNNVVALLAGVGLTLGVWYFMGSMIVIVRRSHRTHQVDIAMRAEAAALDAANATRLRWRTVSLDRAIGVLRSIGEGSVNPTEDEVRVQCAEEERFLRQLTLLDPELVQMGGWFAQALSAARARGVELAVRAGSVDVHVDDASNLGSVLLNVIDSLPRGTALTASLFATGQGLTLLLVAPSPTLSPSFRQFVDGSDGASLRTTADQDVMEIFVPLSPVDVVAGAQPSYGT